MRFILAILIPILLVFPPTQGGGCVTSGADVAAAWASATTCLYIPSGDYAIPTGVLQSSANGLVVYGDGMGRTRLLLPDGQAVSARTYAIRFNGTNQVVRDLSIVGGANPSGPHAILAVSIDQGATGTLVQRVEASNIYGGGSAGGSGIDLYQPGGGRQGATVEGCYIHDGALMTGIIVNSSGNTIRNNRIERTGTTGNQHGIYTQGGYNLIEGNWIESVGGYSIHGWKHAGLFDASGDRYVNNVSLNPGAQHVIVDGLNDSNGKPTTKNVIITGNVFRATQGRLTTGVLVNVPGAIIADNSFEDVARFGAAVIHVASGAHGAIVRGNSIRYTSTFTTQAYGILIQAPAIVDGNVVDSRETSPPITAIMGSPDGAIMGTNFIYRSN